MTRPHPLYVKAAAGDYITPAETARLIRERLARAYPGVTFYVRTSTYSGGSSIRIAYDGIVGYVPISSCHCPTGPTLRDYSPNQCAVCAYMRPLEAIYRDGAPTREQVDAIVGPYAGRNFDGMIDLAYSVRAWMTPAGNAFFGRSDGTGGSHGSDPGYSEPRPVGAVLVHFGAGYVFVDPTLPYDVTHRAEEEARKARARARKAGRISSADVARSRIAYGPARGMRVA